MKQNLNSSEHLTACIQEVSNEFPFPDKKEGFSFHVFYRLLWSCAFLCLPKSKEKHPLFPLQIVPAVSSVPSEPGSGGQQLASLNYGWPDCSNIT